eukprot:Anaeramoba_flamelloidesa1057354_10.p1 GENE.a1057354_10~~a1057354_10.p1  ORF type:complete len:114 (+),score=7.02 a1057354_10:1-342(+)
MIFTSLCALWNALVANTKEKMPLHRTKIEIMKTNKTRCQLALFFFSFESRYRNANERTISIIPNTIAKPFERFSLIHTPEVIRVLNSPRITPVRLETRIFFIVAIYSQFLLDD